MEGVSQVDSLKICLDGDWYFWLLGRGQGWKATTNVMYKKYFQRKRFFVIGQTIGFKQK